MRNLIIKKKIPSGLLLVKIFIFTLCIFSLLQVAIGEASVENKENESALLLQQISQIRNNNTKLKSENKNLQSGIIKKETSYKEKIDNTKIAYLTFDDGPSQNTLAILKILKQYNIKATFFVNGQPKYESLYKQISDDGHTFGNHTYSHDYKKIYSSASNFKMDIKKLDIFLTAITGKKPNHILRFPGGSNNTISNNYGGIKTMDPIIEEMSKSDYTYFDWNVDSSDALIFRQKKDIIVREVLTQSTEHKHPIILMHDLDPKTTTVQALPEIIKGLQNQGFVFDVLTKNTYSPQFKVVN